MYKILEPEMDNICLSEFHETHLDPSTKLDDNNLEISGYKLFHSDHLFCL